MLPLPSRTHPKNQNPLVYTEELTHLSGGGSNRRVQSFDQGSSTLLEFLIPLLEHTVKRSNSCPIYCTRGH